MSATSFTVHAPASSANMGSGFDCAAAALDLWNTLEVLPGNGALAIQGEGADLLVDDTDHLILRLFREYAGPFASTFDLRCTNRIPLARGLGSSTAASALGIIAAWTVRQTPWTGNDLFHELTKLDGHPDNAAAVAFGGIQWCDSNTAITLSRGLTLAAVCISPPELLATSEARAVLPTSVSLRTACAQASAAGLLAAGIVGDNDDLLRRGLAGDELHESARSALVPALGHARSEVMVDENVLGITLSGAGSTVAVWTRPGTVHAVAARCASIFPDAYTVRALTIPQAGAHVQHHS